jgi:arsenic resistance protein ArsH
MTRVRELPEPDHLPAMDLAFARQCPATGLGTLDSPPRIVLMYGAPRKRSFSRYAMEEAARLLL